MEPALQLDKAARAHRADWHLIMLFDCSSHGPASCRIGLETIFVCRLREVLPVLDSNNQYCAKRLLVNLWIITRHGAGQRAVFQPNQLRRQQRSRPIYIKYIVDSVTKSQTQAWPWHCHTQCLHRMSKEADKGKPRECRASSRFQRDLADGPSSPVRRTTPMQPLQVSGIQRVRV
jgi:hypothetical protein